MKTAALLVAASLLAACSSSGVTTTVAAQEEEQPSTRVILVGDIMTGRGLTGVLDSEPQAVFAAVRHLLQGANLAAANLESPLTTLPHTSSNENRLQADPATAITLADAGFDLISLPNNHSMDSGPLGLLETIEAVEGAGMLTVGAGADTASALAPVVVAGEAIQIGFLAFDATGVSGVAGTEAGVSGWDEDRSVAAVMALRDEADVVIVSIHGGTEYLPTTDPGMAHIATALAEAGADIVWGHGAHVVQPVSFIDAPRPTVVATSLGNFLFDQVGPRRTTGYLLEVLVDGNGVKAYRVGVVQHPERRLEFVEWLDPTGDAGWLDGSWWTLTRDIAPAPGTGTNVTEFRHGDLIAAATGDIDGDGTSDVVASFRRPHRMTPFMELHPELQWADAAGRDAHLGVYNPDGLIEIWVAGSVLLPIADLEVCDGSLVLLHDQLDDPTPVAGSAWEWNGFGFDTAPDLPGSGTPACVDVDGDGKTDPVLLNR